MMPGPAQTAHERLTALARWRRRDTPVSGAMPSAMRERLLREVSRQSGAGSGFPEPVPIPAVEAWWRRWRAVAGWVGVGLGAVGVLIVMIRGGQESSQRNRVLGVVSGEAPLMAESGSPGASSRGGGGPVAAPVGLDAPMSAPYAAATSAVVVLADAKPGLGAGRRSESSAAKQMQTQDGMVRLRRRYQAVGESNAIASAVRILRGFEVVRAPDRVEFRDDDGSLYVGRVEDNLVAKEGGQLGWVFEGRGTNVALGKEVFITGYFGPVTEPQAPRADRFMDAPFVGTAVVGETQVVEIRAEPGQ